MGGTSFLLVADETPLPDIGYTLDKVENKGFVADQVCFMTGNIDKKLVKKDIKSWCLSFHHAIYYDSLLVILADHIWCVVDITAAL